MRAIFSVRGILLLWILLTSSIGLNVQLKDLATQMKSSTGAMVVPINSAFEAINKFSLDTANGFFKNVKFDPANVVVDIKGIFAIQTRHMMAFIGLLLLLGAMMLYQGAIRSDSFADDFLALLFFYIFVVIELSIVLGLGFNIAPAFQRGFVLTAFVLIIGVLSLRAGAIHDTRLFFRAVIEIFLLALFLFPDATILGGAAVLSSLADFGNSLRTSATVFLFWCIIGALLALGELYSLGKRPTFRSVRAARRASKPVEPQIESAER